MKKLFKLSLVTTLILGLLFVSGCFGLGETADIAREFFQLVADGDTQGAYDYTGDAFKEFTTADEFVEIVASAQMETYVDFEASGFSYSTEENYTIQTLTGDWYDSFGYYYPIEIYFMEVGDDWKLVGFYFTD